jgi:hypothetical protein
MRIHLLAVILMAVFMGLSTMAVAQAPSAGDPCTTAGEMVQFNDSGIYTHLVCDGANYQAQHLVNGAKSRIQIGHDTGSCTSDKEGRLRYDPGTDNWEYCNNAGSWSVF